MQEMLTPGFGTIGKSAEFLTKNLLRFGKAVSGFFGGSEEFEGVFGLYGGHDSCVGEPSEEEVEAEEKDDEGGRGEQAADVPIVKYSSSDRS